MFHTLIALAGWVLFVYWWWLVFRRVSRAEIRYTALFVGIALVAIVLLTAAWAVHNAWIFRRRGPRRQARAVTPDFSRDVVGREVRLPPVPDECRTAAVVSVRLQDGVKVYAPVPSARPVAPPPTPEAPAVTAPPPGAAPPPPVAPTPTAPALEVPAPPSAPAPAAPAPTAPAPVPEAPAHVARTS